MKSFLFWVLLAAALIAGGAVAAHRWLPGGLPGLFPAGGAGEPYACPMAEDAEVRSDGPGKCRKCGMDLVPLSKTEHGAMAHTARAEGPSGHAGHGGHEPEGKAGGPGGSGRKGEAGRVAAPAGAKGEKRYYCPMHPNVQSDRPGECPVCHMKLRPKEEGSSPDSGIGGMAEVTIRPEQIQLIGVKTGPVEKKPMRKTISAVGPIDYNKRSVHAVTDRFRGCVERLQVSATWQAVKVGDPLLAIYSPELLEAQRSYLLALESALGAPAGGGAAGAASPAMEQGRQSAR